MIRAGIAIIGVLLILGITVALPNEHVRQQVVQFISWVQSLGWVGCLVLGATEVLAVVTCFPLSVMFELGAGLLFGMISGVLLIAVAKVIGASIAFTLGRTLMKQWIERKVQQWEKGSLVYSAIQADSFRLAVALRLSPVPSWINNYGLAISPIAFRDFFMATLIAGLPTIMANVYIGTLMGNITTQAAEGRWVHYITGMLAVCATIFITRYLLKYAQVLLSAKSPKTLPQNHSPTLLRDL